MNLDLLFLGTGASVPTRTRNLSALGVRKGGRSLLIDCGEGTQRQALSTWLSLPTLEAVLITHLHGDHILGLPGALLSMELGHRETALRLLLPAGGAEVLEGLVAPFPLSFPLIMEELSPGDEVEDVIGCRLRTVAVRHRLPGLAYRLDEPPRPGRFDPEAARARGVDPGPQYGDLQAGKPVEVAGATVRPHEVLGPERSGRSVVVSGDTAAFPEMAEFARGADVLIHEATFSEDLEQLAEERGHSTAAGAARVARDAEVERLFLVHISPRYHAPDQRARLLAEAREIFPATEIPDDLAAVSVDHRD